MIGTLQTTCLKPFGPGVAVVQMQQGKLQQSDGLVMRLPMPDFARAQRSPSGGTAKHSEHSRGFFGPLSHRFPSATPTRVARTSGASSKRRF